MGNTFYFEFEPILMQWFQGVLGEKGALVLSQFSALGEEFIILLVMGFLYWCYDKKIGIYVATNALIGTTLNPMIKNVFLRRRPYMVHDGVKCFRPVDKSADIYDIAAQGYSFPSGHSTNSVVVYGSVAKFLRNKVLTILAFVLPLLVGISRVAVGVHYPTDVICGWLSGVLVVFFIPFIYEKAGEEKRPLLNLIVFAVSAVGFFYCRTTDYFTAMGLMGGFFLAIEFEKRFVNFEETRRPVEIVLRIVGGFAVYLVLNTLLKLPFSKYFLQSDTMGSFMVRFIRYMIVSFVMMGVYPVLFKVFEKSRLAQKI
ncbi:phosphatase PAP2 family protein [Butyrivibrio sp. AE3004]|uniref:phosphatase PAP2 family protein n=1 Tax=Butyrivibrio sp. AE3004 TaxID=1506994 RepID=UPI000494057E|nr:phosphatase PAP2 family protein [Butyrivibrio sp. AE3004]